MKTTMRKGPLLLLLALFSGCFETEKAPEPCVAGEIRCDLDGRSIEQCATDGLKWVVLETCRNGMVCVDAKCSLPPNDAAVADASDAFPNDGGCIPPCADDRECLDGHCYCKAPETDCSGTCADFMTDDQHCGACEGACPAGTHCTAGKCHGDGKSMLYCDGQWTDTLTSSEHCGECDIACWKGDCGGGLCEERPLAISLGSEHACLRSALGEVYCWGGGFWGQLGLGDTSKDDEPEPQKIPTLRNITQISAGEYHTCALDSTGKVYCWGNNETGEIGQEPEGLWASVDSPTEIASSESFKSVVCGNNHTCAINDGGKVFCWGNNPSIYAGSGVGCETSDDNPIITPCQVDNLTDVISLSAGDDFTCALKSDKTVYCWGKNDDYQLGKKLEFQELYPYENTPVKVENIGSPTEIVSGLKGTCAFDPAVPDSLYCWGSVPGSFTTDFQNISNVEAVAIGENHTCVVDSSSRVQCWGSNSSGQLGTGPLGGTYALGIEDATAVSVGGFFTCAIAKKGTYCWGSDWKGQLGNGLPFENSDTPESIASPSP